uniref:Ig-like domain-containing protein n=1 Tax=Pelodiscus sinensis TaxID=13735 RepID=K7FAB9_PELSI
PGMTPAWLSAVLLTALLGGASGADTVTQTEGSVGISQGDPLRLNCTYQFSFTTSLFWYVQYPGQAPRMLLEDLAGQNSGEGIREGFDATHETKDKSFHLWKASVELSDSATYYCA